MTIRELGRNVAQFVAFKFGADGSSYLLWEEEAMLVMFLLAALGSSIPQADINKICESARVDSLPEDRVTAMRGCVGDETSARDELRRDWGKK